MSTCVAILKSGKGKGTVCGKKANNEFNGEQYCGRHINVISNKDTVTELAKTVKTLKLDKKQTVKTVPIDFQDIDLINNLLLKSNNDKYEVVKFLGQGSFGCVYLITRNKDKENYALKLTYVQHPITIRDKNLIYWENNLLSLHLFDCDNIIKLAPTKSYFNNDKYAYIITDYYEETLETRMNNRDKKMGNKRIKYYGYKLVKIMYELHRRNFIYIDIKPDNIMFETIDSDEPIMIDFGLTIIYRNVKGSHVIQNTLNTDVGTPLFSSIFANSNLTPDRYGDLQSIGYLLLYLSNNKLPWSDLHNSQDILESKKEILDCDEYKNAPDYIKSFISKTSDKQYGDDPDYQELLNLLKNE